MIHKKTSAFKTVISFLPIQVNYAFCMGKYFNFRITEKSNTP